MHRTAAIVPFMLALAWPGLGWPGSAWAEETTAEEPHPLKAFVNRKSRYGIRVEKLEHAVSATDETVPRGKIRYSAKLSYNPSPAQKLTDQILIDVYHLPFDANGVPGTVQADPQKIPRDSGNATEDFEISGEFQPVAENFSGWVAVILVGRETAEDRPSLLAHKLCHLSTGAEDTSRPLSRHFTPQPYLDHPSEGTFVSRLVTYGQEVTAKQPFELINQHVEFEYATTRTDKFAVTVDVERFLLMYNTNLEPKKQDQNGCTVPVFRDGISGRGSSSSGHSLQEYPYGGWTTLILVAQDSLETSLRLIAYETKYTPLLSEEEIKETFDDDGTPGR